MYLSFEEMEIQRVREANAKSMAEFLRQGELEDKKRDEEKKKNKPPSVHLSFEEMDIQRAREANRRVGERFLAEPE